MNRQEYLDFIKATFDECHQLATAKGADYCGVTDPFKNFRGYSLTGVSIPQGILTRIIDKVSRAGNFISRGEAFMVVTEKLEDTLKDLLTYTVILLAYLESERRKSQEESIESK